MSVSLAAGCSRLVVAGVPLSGQKVPHSSDAGEHPEVFGIDRRRDGLPHYDFAVCAAQKGLVPTTSGFATSAVTIRSTLDGAYPGGGVGPG
jgi:hypothetical protein